MQITIRALAYAQKMKQQQDQKELEERRISSQEQIAGANIGQKIASDLLDSNFQNKKQAAKEFKLSSVWGLAQGSYT